DMLASARVEQAIDAFVKLDTGMSRLGFSAADYPAAYERARAMQAEGLVDTLGKMTHFARAADDPDVTRQQLQVFDRVTTGLPGSVGVCSSAATSPPGVWSSVPGGPEQWVRPGTCLYGASPFAGTSADCLDLRPAMTLSS